MKVFVLQHTHQLSDEEEDVKFIGVYSTETSGEAAIKALLVQPGFSEHPEGFHLSVHELDETNWTEGFVTVPPPNSDSEETA